MRTRVRRISIALAAAVLLPAAPPAPANHLTIPDVASVRTPISRNEGYLSYLFNPVTMDFGEEYTGWIDTRHPALDGPPDTVGGYDRSDHRVNVRAVTVTDNAGVAAAPQIPRDFNFSSKIYAQSGLSVIQTEEATLTLDGTGGTPATAWPISWPGAASDFSVMLRSARSAVAPTVNDYYVRGLAPVLNGVTNLPFGFGGNTPRNDGSGIADIAVNNTHAHELGHMLLNANSAFHMNCNPALPGANPASGPASESCDTTNFMYKTGGFAASSLLQVGPVIAPGVGGRDIVVAAQTERFYANAGANNPGFVRLDHHDAAGDRVDWDFVADQLDLEGLANGADNHRAVESLYWGLGTTVEPAHIWADGVSVDPHNHRGMDRFGPKPDWSDPFRIVDVFSLNTLYSDMDVSAGVGTVSVRESALDYNLFFELLDGSVVRGAPLFDFIPGWTPNQTADDYLARWLSPAPAKGVFIFAERGSLHDGTTQIDAVITGQEPFANFLLGPAFGDGFSPTMSYDPATGLLTFTPGIVDTLGTNGRGAGGVDPLFTGDPMSGALIELSDMMLLSPMDDGFLFGNGSIAVRQGADLLLSADIPLLLVDDGMRPVFGNNIIGTFTNVFVNDMIGSMFLDLFASTLDGPNTLATELFGFSTLDLVPLIAAGTAFSTEIELFGGHSIVAEPPVTLLLLAYLAWLLGASRVAHGRVRDARG